MDDAMILVAERDGEAGARFRARHAALAQRLRVAGITRIAAHYDGQEEERHFYQVDGFDGLRTRAIPNALLEELREHLHDALEARYGAWQLGDGACGCFDWDIARDASYHVHRIRTVRYQHCTRRTWADLLGDVRDEH